ncbi:putative ribonuclease H-like domain-containing protein [Tanacetum coccineum]
MRPFRCPVTILNTLDHLGKLDGKADEGFFFGYSVTSKVFRVFNTRTRIVKESLHITFLENKPNVAGNRQTWLFDIDTLTKSINYELVVAGNQSNGNASTKACDDVGKDSMKTVPEKDYILLPLWTVDPPFSQNPRSSQYDGSIPSNDDGKKDDDDPREDSKGVDQEKEDDVNSTNTVNTASTNEVNVVGAKTSIELPDDPNMPSLEEIAYSDDNEDVGSEADINNLDAFMPVSHIPTTRVHKDHHVEQIIGDLNSAPQTRRMTNQLQEHGLVSRIQQINHKDFQNCLFACFLSQVEPKKAKGKLGLNGSTGTEVERGIVYDRNTRQGGSEVARIEAIRLFLAYASFKDFVIYQMDVKSAFLYEKIEEEVYVCQPPGFENLDFPDRVYKVEKALYGLHQALRAWSASEAEGRIGDCSLVQDNGKAAEDGIGVKTGNLKVSTIGQNTGVVKKVNGDAQIHALIDGKKIVVSEVTIRRDLQLADEEWIACLLLQFLKILQEWGVITSLFPTMVVQNQPQPPTITLTPTTSTQTPTPDQPTTSIQPSQLQKSIRKPTRKDTKAKINVDYELAQRLQGEEQEELSDEEKAKLFVQLMEARKKHFAAKRAKEQRSKPPTKAQNRKTIATKRVNTFVDMDTEVVEGSSKRAGTEVVKEKANQLKNKSYDEIQKLFDRAMKRVNQFLDMDTEVVEGSSKRACNELEQETKKKQKKDDDKEIAELQMLVNIIPDEEEVSIDAIPLATKPPVIVLLKLLLLKLKLKVNTAQAQFNTVKTERIRAYWEADLRMIATEEGLVNYLARITYVGDFLGPPHSYTSIREPLKSMDEGTVVRNLPTINLEELIKLGICERVMDMVSWVVEDPSRKQVRAAGRGAEIDLEGPQDAPTG